MSKQTASGRGPGRPITQGAQAANAVDRAHGLVEALHSSAQRIEAARALPPDIVASLHQARLFRLLLPRSLGGDELHLKRLSEVMDGIGGADARTAWCMGHAAGWADE